MINSEGDLGLGKEMCNRGFGAILNLTVVLLDVTRSERDAMARCARSSSIRVGLLTCVQIFRTLLTAV